MPNSHLPIVICIFFAAVFFVLGLLHLFRNRRSPATASSETTDSSNKPFFFKIFANEISQCSRISASFYADSNPAQQALSQDLVAGALDISALEVRGAQLFAAVLGGAVALLPVFLLSSERVYALLATMLGAWLGWSYPMILIRKAAEERKELISKALPFAIDLLTVATQAGQDFGAALRNLVGSGFTGPLITEFGIVLRQIELGKNRVEALRTMADRIQIEEFRSLVTAIVQSTELGASITQTMKIQAEEIRRARFHRAERRAARAPSIMLLPTALFILPAVFIVIFTPIIIRVIDSGVPIGR
jgi:pilus assembly protein TadC